MNLPNRWRAASGLIPLLACTLGCGAPSEDFSDGFPMESLASATTEDDALRIEVRTSPSQPPERGNARAELRITDAVSGAPRDDLSLAVTPWMPAMGHGASVRPTVVARGEGIYELSNVSFFMSGRWELRLQVNDDASRTAVVSLDVL